MDPAVCLARSGPHVSPEPPSSCCRLQDGETEVQLSLQPAGCSPTGASPVFPDVLPTFSRQRSSPASLGSCHTDLERIPVPALEETLCISCSRTCPRCPPAWQSPRQCGLRTPPRTNLSCGSSAWLRHSVNRCHSRSRQRPQCQRWGRLSSLSTALRGQQHLCPEQLSVQLSSRLPAWGILCSEPTEGWWSEAERSAAPRSGQDRPPWGARAVSRASRAQALSYCCFKTVVGGVVPTPHAESPRGGVEREPGQGWGTHVFLFLFFHFGHPAACGVARPGTRSKPCLPSKPQLRQRRVLNPPCWAGDGTCG